MKNLNLIIFLAFVLSVFACSTKNEQVTTTTTQRLTKTWRPTAVMVNNQAKDIAAYESHRFTFRPDGTYAFNLGTETEGTWELTSNETSLLLNKDTDRQEAVGILHIADEALKLQFFEEGSEKLGGETIVYDLVPAN